MLDALGATGAPAGIYELICSLYSFNHAFAIADGEAKFLYNVTGGVLQGSPLSGLPFAIAIDPVLRNFDDVVVKKGLGTVLACADDIGAALHHIDTLIDIKGIFDEAKAVSNLTLKPTKCIVVPLAPPCSPASSAAICCWLSRALPAWGSCAVAGAARIPRFLAGTPRPIPPLVQCGWEMEEKDYRHCSRQTAPRP